MDFLFHKVSEEEREEIKKEAKKILDDFSEKLEKVSKVSESVIERGEGDREEDRESNSPTADSPADSQLRTSINNQLLSTTKLLAHPKSDESFSREIFFENAPNKNKDFIIGEKKSWQ